MKKHRVKKSKEIFSIQNRIGRFKMFDKLARIISENTNIALAEIKPETDLMIDLKLSSMDLINIVVAVEESFQVSIPDRELVYISTAQDVVDLLEKKRPGKGDR